MRRSLVSLGALLLWGTWVWADDEKIDVEALLADDALLDDLLYGDADIPLVEENTASWDWENRLSLGAGYKRNVLFNAFSEESSVFSLSEWESTLLRLTSPGEWQIFGYLVAENRHYVDVDDLDDEWMVLALAQAEKPVGDWKFGMGVQYLHLQQAFSLEFEEIDLGSTEIALHQLQLIPRVQYALPENDVFFGLSLPLAMNWFDDSSQNYEEIGVVAELGKKFASGAKLTLSYGYERRDYDERLERTTDGDSIEGSSLSWQEHQFDLGFDFHLDEAKRWRSKSLLRYRLVEDDGSGYQDFAMAKFAQRIGFHHDPWGISLNGSYTHYDYAVQTKEAGDSNQRHRSRLSVGLALERDFGKAWQGFARYDFESYLSNVPEDDYDVHAFTFGMRYTF